MSTPSPSPKPNPIAFFDAVNSYERTEALRAAVELELFTAIGEGFTTPEAIGPHVGASERGVRILCDFLTINGFLTKQNGVYGLTPDTAVFLDKRSRAYLGGTLRFLLSDTIREGFRDLAGAVRKGGTVVSAEGTMAPDHPVWRDFARAMVPMMAMPAEEIAGLVGSASGEAWKVLDIAAGHGIFGIAIARQNPNASIVAVDWPAVLEVAREHALAAGVGDRHSSIGGSAFDVEFGTGYDLALITNFLHHFDPATNETLLRKVCAALKPGGRCVTLEFVPNDDRVSPPMIATFSLMMLSSTAHGDAYTFAELEQMAANSGFSRSEMIQLQASLQRIVISYK